MVRILLKTIYSFELKETCFNTMINYQFSQMLKLLGNCEFNHLTIILTLIVVLQAEQVVHQSALALISEA